MRRIGVAGSLLILALLVASLVLVACGSSDEPAATVASPAAGTSLPTEPDGDTKVSTSFAVGENVAAVWTDGNLYLATVTAVEGDQVTVTYTDDGSSATVAASECRPIPDATFGVGDRVLAVWAAGRFYPGEVTAVDGNMSTVKWDDGSEPSQVEAGKIIAE
jgi:hypothetical protein